MSDSPNPTPAAETRTVRFVFMVGPGRSILADSVAGHYLPGRVLTVGMPGLRTQKDIDDLVRSGSVVQVPEGTDINDLAVVARANARAQSLRTQGEASGEIDDSKVSDKVTRVVAPPMDPSPLRQRVKDGQLSLAQLNEMVRGRDAGAGPFDSTDLAISFLSAGHDRGSPLPPKMPA